MTPKKTVSSARVSEAGEKAIDKLDAKEFRERFSIPNGVSIELVNEEAAMPTEKGEENVILFTKEQFNAGLRFPLPALFKEFLHFSQIPPIFIHPNLVRVLMGCSIINMLYSLDLTLLEVFFVYSLKKAKNDIFSVSAHLSSLQMVTELPDSTKGGAKGLVAVGGVWAGLSQRASRPFSPNYTLKFRVIFRIGRIPEWPPQDSNPSPRLKDDKVALLDSNPSPRLKDDKVALLVPSALVAQMVPGGQPYRLELRGHLVDWVEKASFACVCKLFEIDPKERAYKTLLSARNLIAVVRESQEYVINILPRKLAKDEIVPGEHYTLKELPLYQEAKEADGERRRKLLEDRDQKKNEGTIRKAPGQKRGPDSPPKKTSGKRRKLVKKHGKDVKEPTPPKEFPPPQITYEGEVMIEEPVNAAPHSISSGPGRMLGLNHSGPSLAAATCLANVAEEAASINRPGNLNPDVDAAETAPLEEAGAESQSQPSDDPDRLALVLVKGPPPKKPRSTRDLRSGLLGRLQERQQEIEVSCASAHDAHPDGGEVEMATETSAAPAIIPTEDASGHMCPDEDVGVPIPGQELPSASSSEEDPTDDAAPASPSATRSWKLIRFMSLLFLFAYQLVRGLRSMSQQHDLFTQLLQTADYMRTFPQTAPMLSPRVSSGPRCCQMDGHVILNTQGVLDSAVAPAKGIRTGCSDAPSDGLVSHGEREIYKSVGLLLGVSRSIIILRTTVRNHGDGMWAMAACCDCVGIRMMMVRMIICATRHHELRATCFSRGGVPTTITGHSQGGALALLNAYEAASSLPDLDHISVISFGAPRVGNITFRDKMNEMGVKILRVVVKQDIVPKLPGIICNKILRQIHALTRRLKWVYRHIGSELKLDVIVSLLEARI
ncbi:Phospholipase A1-Igamma2, chloroplastic [Vitis vinifera]|uniref:Phospholipase A1-Igamma2, chloroplastic n=1 Tax=Vitis vinifera TaxID=29760 RepID=A0A438CKG9_VITVI|nr:Phospholipase A1-Igamma2, chloroplastic [Vitis vinifera]